MTRPTPQTPASDPPPSGAGHAPARADGPPLPKQPWRAKAPAAATPPVAAGPSPVVASTTQAAAEQDPNCGASWASPHEALCSTEQCPKGCKIAATKDDALKVWTARWRKETARA